MNFIGFPLYLAKTRRLLAGLSPMNVRKLASSFPRYTAIVKYDRFLIDKTHIVTMQVVHSIAFTKVKERLEKVPSVTSVKVKQPERVYVHVLHPIDKGVKFMLMF